MPLIINTNVASLIAQRSLTTNTNALNKALERLSSGYRINRAADDAAGLQISETLRAQIRGIAVAINNTEDGTNILQIAEGSLNVIQNNLQRIRELAVQAANDTNGTAQRDSMEQEIKALLNDINRIANATQFNGISLLNSNAPNDFYIQVGPNSSLAIDTVNIASALIDSRVSALGVLNGSAGFTTINGIDITSNSVARAFLRDIDNALTIVSQTRAIIGSFQNRFISTIENLRSQFENFSSAESRIRDLDVAAETAELTRAQILQQSTVSVLSQANQAPSLALSLIGG